MLVSIGGHNEALVVCGKENFAPHNKVLSAGENGSSTHTHTLKPVVLWLVLRLLPTSLAEKYKNSFKKCVQSTFELISHRLYDVLAPTQSPVNGNQAVYSTLAVVCVYKKTTFLKCTIKRKFKF